MKHSLAVLTFVLAFAVAEGAELRGALAWTAGAGFTPGAPPLAQWSLAGHLEGRYEAGAFSASTVLEPSFTAVSSGEGRFALRLSEALLRYRSPRFDFTLGKIRFPLETARLMLPFSIEAVSPAGARQGLWAGRIDAFLGATRLGVALAYRESRWVPLLRAARSFGSVDLSGNLLYMGGRTVIGVGGSGLVGDLVAYGEAWGLTNPPEGRVMLGLSGFLKEALWMLEGGWIQGTPQVAGQVLVPLNETDALTVDGRASFSAGVTGGLTVRVSRSLADREYALSLQRALGPAVPAYWVRLEAHAFF